METEDLGTNDRTQVGSGALAAAIGFFGVIVVLIGFDIVSDYLAGTNPRHVFTEAFIMAVALVGVVLLWRQLRSVQHRAEELKTDLEAAREEAQRFREEAHDALRGLGEAIDRQFTRWSL